MQIGQSHVSGVLGGREFINRRDETICVLIQLVEKSQHAQFRLNRDRELCPGVVVVVRAVLLLLEKSRWCWLAQLQLNFKSLH